MPRVRLPLLITSGRLAALGLVVTVFTVTGCGSNTDPPYEPGWKYPPRTDPVVVSPPTEHPTGRHEEPEKLDEYISQLPDRGGVIVRPDQLPAGQVERLTVVLESLFGTPSAPAIADLEPSLAERFALDADSLLAGARKYKVACANCHGMTGDGRGTAGLWAFPHPRDFRTGEFKRATGAGANTGRPRFADLVSVIQMGVPGTTMGATGLPEVEVRPLAGYTLFLSARGEVELELLKALADPVEAPSDVEAEAKRQLSRVLKKWADADAEVSLPHVVRPQPEDVTPDYAESLRRGQRLFVSQQAACTTCHTDYGRGTSYRYDVWGVPNRVRNLTDKPRHWARTPEEFARQLRYGIHAAGMPAVSQDLTDQDVADLVHFTRELPYPQRLPDDVRQEVYPR